MLEDAERRGRTHELALPPLPDPLHLPQLAALALHVAAVEICVNGTVKLHAIDATRHRCDATMKA